MLNDELMILKIGNTNFGEGSNFVAKQVHDHHECKRNDLYKKNKSSNIKDSVLERILSYVRNKIIAEIKPEVAPFLLDLHKQCYAAEGGNENDLAVYNVQNMCRMLQLRVPLNIEAKKNKAVVWKKGNMKYDEALRLIKINAESDDCMMWRCASKLCNYIFAVQNKQTCEQATIDNIVEGETITPDSVKSFFKLLYTENLSETEELSSRISPVIVSSAADAVFCCCAGKLTPGKELSLGFTLKSMTGSKKVLRLMNRYGHCASSETVRRVDIYFESTLNNFNSFIPDGIETKPNLSTGTAWGNFNINLETRSRADTIHHTYGICYQTIKETDEIETEKSSEIHLKLYQPPNQL